MNTYGPTENAATTKPRRQPSRGILRRLMPVAVSLPIAWALDWGVTTVVPVAWRALAWGMIHLLLFVAVVVVLVIGDQRN